MTIPIPELKVLMEQVVASKYYTPEEAAKIVEVLLYAELSGKNTQGFLKLLGSGAMQDIEPKYKPKIVRETELSALIDGGGSAGPLGAQLAVDTVIDIAGRKGFGIVGMNNTFSSVGVIGYYARKIAQQNLIGLVMASSPRAIAHFGSIDPTYGTNPLAFGFPTQDHPIVFDMATSATTWYGLVRAQALGQPLPDNVAIDHDGNITTDPAAAMKGAILPFDRYYKGSGLAMVVELLAGVLTGADYVFEDGDWGTTFIAISPNLLMDIDDFKQRSSDLITKVQSQRTKPGETIRIPGYDTEQTIQEKLEKGEIEVEEKLIKGLTKNL